MARHDELGRLAEEFNGMCRRLELAQQRLLELQAEESPPASGGVLEPAAHARRHGRGVLRLDGHAEPEQVHAVVVEGRLEAHRVAMPGLPGLGLRQQALAEGRAQPLRLAHERGVRVGRGRRGGGIPGEGSELEHPGRAGRERVGGGGAGCVVGVAHLAECDRCRRQLVEYEHVASSLAYTAPP